MFKAFSANQIETMAGERKAASMYAIETAMRVEAEEQGKKGITIMRYDRGVMWVFMPDQKKYVEMPWQNLVKFGLAKP
jgi:hypothetical protein